MMTIPSRSTAAICLLLLPFLVLATNGHDARGMLRHRSGAKSHERVLQSSGYDDPREGEFELDGKLDRPNAEADIPGPGDAFEMDAKMPKRDEVPNRVSEIEFATTAPTGGPMVSFPPTTLAPTTLTPTTLRPTTLEPTRMVTPEPTTLQPTPPKRAITLAPSTLEPTSLEPTTFAPTTLMPTTIPPTPEPTTSPPTPEPSHNPTSLPPTTLPPTTLQPTTLLPTTMLPTTVAPTTLHPTPEQTPQPTTPRPTPQPTNMPTGISRVAEFIREIEGEVVGDHDYVIPLGAYPFMIPERLIHELIKTLELGESVVKPLFGPYESEFKMADFLYALNISYDWDVNIADNDIMDRNGNRDLLQMQEMVSNIPPTPSPTAVLINLGGERDGPGALGRVDVALAHMGLLLGQAYEESMITGMCDEQNTNPVDKVNPGCGQHGENYRFPGTDAQLGQGDFTCFANENEWMTGFRPVPNEPDAQMNREFVGCPLQPPVGIIEGKIMPSNKPKNEYQALPMKCGVNATIGCRDCCWWGRGMLQMTHQCNYGDFQRNWGAYYQVPDREDIEVCSNPAQVCAENFPEMRYLTGLFTWIKSVVHNPGFNFNEELEQWVDSGMDMSEGSFVDRVGGALVYGDPNKRPPNAEQRRNYTKAAVEALMPIPAFGVEQYFHYGDVALCKPAVQSSIFNSTRDRAARSALTGERNATRMAETDCDHDPFWKVDLGSPYQILSIHIVWHNRYHEEMRDLPEQNATGNWDTTHTNYQLVVDLLDENGNNVASLDRSQFVHSVERDGEIESEWTIKVENVTDLQASQVRVSSLSPDNECRYLSLAQVMVMSVCKLGDACLTKSSCEEQNVAQCKPTVQSSTAEAKTANLAVDGINGEPATTECEESPFFMVDLYGMYNITAVALINHADRIGLERLNGVVVELLDINNNVVAEDSHNPRLLGDKVGDVYVMKFDNEPAIACKVRVSLQHAAGTCEPLRLAEVAVMGTCLDDGEHCKTWENCKLQNVARCMPSTQSSIFDGSIAARAVDGHVSLAQTTCEQEPWWGVTLLGSHPVSEVVIHNREDCCFERLNSVQVSLLDDAGNTLSTVVHDPLTDGVIETSWKAVFPDMVAASKVRILTTHDPGTCESLALAEVQVMSPCADGDLSCLTWALCDNGNIAQCKPAQQSSTINGGVAANAVNGHESLSHTDCEIDPWWEVALLRPRVVDAVVIHNREDCCWDRLNGILIELFDEAGSVVRSIQHDPVSMGEIKTMWVATMEPVKATRVRLSVQHPEDTCDFLNLSEVEVRSTCEEGDACLTGFGCDHGNVAKCKPARQSSTLPAVNTTTFYQGVAGEAVDGTESLAHTDCEKEPWWEVDLLYRREVSDVIVHNREDCCFERLNGVIVDLLDKEHNVIARVQHNLERDGEINTMWIASFPPMSMAWYVRLMLKYPEGVCGYLNIAEVEVISKCEEGDACMNPDMECVQGNVAQCKPARQISTIEGAVARKAVDSERTYSRTDCEERPWWEVDLQGVYHVSEVVVFNREDNPFQLNNVMVELLNATGHTVKMVQHDPVANGVLSHMWSAKFDDFGDYAKKVRVSMLNEIGECSFLDIADVQVMSTCLDTDACYYGHSCDDGNVAQCKPASQSSTRDGMVADKALDGEESLSMTECEPNPWWKVDLLTEYSVKEVAVYNRRDCCFHQLNGVLVELLDANGAVIDSVRHSPKGMGEIKDVWVARFNPAQTAPARAVRVSLKHEHGDCGYLELAEVQVLSACKETDACMTGYDCEHSWIEST